MASGVRDSSVGEVPAVKIEELSLDPQHDVKAGHSGSICDRRTEGSADGDRQIPTAQWSSLASLGSVSNSCSICMIPSSQGSEVMQKRKQKGFKS